MSLPTRKIGHEQVPVPGLGCMGMSAFYSTTGKTDADSIKVLKAAYDAGCRFWDTADIYGSDHMGQNEELIAKGIKELGIPRKDIFLATKFAHFFTPEGSLGVRGEPEYVKSAIEKSLAALQTDYVDLYYQHRVDPKVPIEETIKAMKELQDAGKIRYIGMSECNAETLRRASKVAKIDALQVEYSLWETTPETNGLLEACKELGTAFVAYSPLGRGMLSGKFKSRDDLPADDWRRTLPRFSEENFPKNLQLIDQINQLAKKKGCTPGQLALAWVHAQWEGIIAIPGTTRVEALKENVESIKISLSHEELAEIRKVLDSFPVTGGRYDAASMTTLNH